MNATEQWQLALLAPWGRVLLAVGLGLAALALALSWWGLRRERRPWRRALLGALRALGILAAVTCFLQPGLQFQEVLRLPNHVAILVDDSQSMALAERPGGASRLERALRLLDASSATFAAWRLEHKLDFFVFGDELEAISETALKAGAAANRGHAPTTRLGEAIEALRARYAAGDLGGVILLSDGIDHGRWAEGGLTEGRDLLRSLGAPVHTLWTGEPGLPDLSIARILADDFAFARNVVKIEVLVRALGVRAAGWRGRSVPVSLRRDGSTLRTIQVTLDENRAEQKVAFEFTPERVGKFVYEVTSPVLEGDRLPANNSRCFQLKILRDRVRVLQLAGRPSWDVRFLRGLLKHDPNVDLISFFILRTPDDVDNVSTDELSLIPFPTRELFLEQLRSFDVLFLQNLDFAPYGIGAYLGEIKRFVEEGGGLAMVGGDQSFTSGGYARTPIAGVLPLELLDPPPAAAGSLIAPESFRPQLTLAGRGHPVTALRPALDENRRRWESLPPLEGANLVGRARPGATVLAVHPSLQSDNGQAMPVLAVADVGKGRSLAFTSDSSWRWGFGLAATSRGETRAREYQHFWESAIRWLIHDPELRLLRLDAIKPDWLPGERVRLQLHARNTDYRPLAGVDVTITLSRIAGAGSSPQGGPLRVRTDDAGEAIVELPSLPPGGYRATARGRTGGPRSMGQDDEVFVVHAAGPELEDPEARDDLLRQVATTSGGTWRPLAAGMGGLSLLEPRVVRVSRTQDLELWSTWITLLLAGGAWILEWGLRRRWGLA